MAGIAHVVQQHRMNGKKTHTFDSFAKRKKYRKHEGFITFTTKIKFCQRRMTNHTLTAKKNRNQRSTFCWFLLFRAMKSTLVHMHTHFMSSS